MMQGVSRGSFAAAEDRLEALLDSLPGAADRISLAEDLFGVVGLLDSSPALRRALTDPSRDGADKAALVTRLLEHSVGRDTTALVAGVVRDRWSRSGDITDGLESLGITAVLAAAEAGARLDTVEEEVFRFERIVAGDAGLRRALTETRSPVSARAALIERLLEPRSEPETQVLVRHIATQARGRPPEALFELVLQAAARRRERLVAHVTSAAMLTQAQRDRLTAILSERCGQEIRLAVDLDPAVVGGVRVRIGDDVYDGTLARRISEAAERITR